MDAIFSIIVIAAFIYVIPKIHDFLEDAYMEHGWFRVCLGILGGAALLSLLAQLFRAFTKK